MVDHYDGIVTMSSQLVPSEDVLSPPSTPQVTVWSPGYNWNKSSNRRLGRVVTNIKGFSAGITESSSFSSNYWCDQSLMSV